MAVTNQLLENYVEGKRVSLHINIIRGSMQTVIQLFFKRYVSKNDTIGTLLHKSSVFFNDPDKELPELLNLFDQLAEKVFDSYTGSNVNGAELRDWILQQREYIES